MKKVLKAMLRFVPMLAVMVIIYWFSAMEGDESTDTSGLFLRAIAKIAESLSKHELSNDALGAMHLVIRKCAHFSEYAVLGISAMYAFNQIIGSRLLLIIWSEILSFLYACTDEWHQYHVPGRFGTFSDVLIDSAGAITGILLAFFIFRAFREKRLK